MEKLYGKFVRCIIICNSSLFFEIGGILHRNFQENDSQLKR